MRVRRGIGLALVSILFTTVPATAEQDGKQHRLVERSFHPLTNDPGYAAPPAIQMIEDNRVFAYIGTLLRVDHCHSTDHADRKDRAGIIVVELTDPDQPVLAGIIPTTPGAQTKDVRMFTGATADGKRRDLLVFGREPCTAGNVAEQVALSAEREQIPYPWTGFEVYDVTEPETPEKLGDW